MTAASRLVSEITGFVVQPNKAIVGRNAFSHQSGIHQDGMLKNPLTYQIMTAAEVGADEYRLVLGKNSGRNGFACACARWGSSSVPMPISIALSPVSRISPIKGIALR